VKKLRYLKNRSRLELDYKQFVQTLESGLTRNRKVIDVIATTKKGEVVVGRVASKLTQRMGPLINGDYIKISGTKVKISKEDADSGRIPIEITIKLIDQEIVLTSKRTMSIFETLFQRMVGGGKLSRLIYLTT
jgi:hypothetical protein